MLQDQSCHSEEKVILGLKSLQILFHSIKKKKKCIWSLEEEYNLREFLPYVMNPTRPYVCCMVLFYHWNLLLSHSLHEWKLNKVSSFSETITDLIGSRSSRMFSFPHNYFQLIENVCLLSQLLWSVNDYEKDNTSSSI